MLCKSNSYEYTYGFVHLLLVAEAVLGIVLDGSAEQSIHEGSLPETTLSYNHDGESSTSVRPFWIQLAHDFSGPIP